MPLTPIDPTLVAAEFYWLDMPAGVPPFHTFVTGKLSPDGSTFQTTAPTQAGRAAVVVTTVTAQNFASATTCTGFASCAILPDNETIGPVFVEVVP